MNKSSNEDSKELNNSKGLNTSQNKEIKDQFFRLLMQGNSRKARQMILKNEIYPELIIDNEG